MQYLDDNKITAKGTFDEWLQMINKEKDYESEPWTATELDEVINMDHGVPVTIHNTKHFNSRFVNVNSIFMNNVIKDMQPDDTDLVHVYIAGKEEPLCLMHDNTAYIVAPYVD